MNYIDINLKTIKPAEINYIAGSFQAGKIVVTPTDTIYGLSCLASNQSAVKKIYRLKKRDSKKPVLILVSSLAMLKKYVYLSSQQANLLKKIWSKTALPTTVILASRQILPKNIEGNSGSLAARLPKSDFLIKILRVVKEPLVSTSLNISGQKNINDLKKIDYYFPQKSLQPDLIIDAGKSRKRKPSRLIDLREGKIEVIRK